MLEIIEHMNMLYKGESKVECQSAATSSSPALPLGGDPLGFLRANEPMNQKNWLL